MALINGALQIGRSGLTASQAGLAVTGNNMANAATPSYSRQQALLAPTQATEIVPGKFTGTGVALYDVLRKVDDALNGRIRTAVGDSSSYMVQQQAMTRVEAAFNELTEQDLSSRLSAFFSSFSALQSQPHDIATRNVVLQEGANLCNFVVELRDELDSIQEDLDTQVRYQVEQADALASQIAELNQQVVTTEAGRAGSAAALRDQRDDLLKQLSELINIHTREVEGGSVNVFIGNEPLIQYADSRGIEYKETTDTNTNNRLAQVVFSDNKEAVDLTSGKIHGLITGRDTHLSGVISDLDTWTQSLIHEVNKLHTLGRGLDNHTSLTSQFNVDDPDASLALMADTDLKWAADNGVFYVQVFDSNGEPADSPQMVEVSIGMDANDTTLNTLAASLDAINGISATVNSSNYLEINAAAGYTFAFSSPTDADDASNVLAILGINSFFEGYNAGTISVNSDLTARKLAAGANSLTGNGDVAGSIADLALNGVDSLNGISLTQSFTSLVGEVSTNSKSAQDNYTASNVIMETLELERQTISGVSVDEEALNMITFQRAFQGSARYINLVNQMIDEVLSLL
ncbi:MAG: flagellar hook-associated protein FlgK [Sedimentisphaerales bacterium]|nr:flagellar hook-associated protein FlgK [Sedimentisphaerales bacterium]